MYEWNQLRILTAKPIEFQPVIEPTSEVFGLRADLSEVKDVPTNQLLEAGESVGPHNSMVSESEAEPSDEDDVLGIGMDEIRLIKTWAMHSVNVQMKFMHHQDLSLYNLVFWSQSLQRLFVLDEHQSSIDLNKLADMYGFKIASEPASVNSCYQKKERLLPQGKRKRYAKRTIKSSTKRPHFDISKLSNDSSESEQSSLENSDSDTD